MATDIRFSSLADAQTIVCPEKRASIDVWHETEAGFGVRVGRPRLRDGAAHRIYIARFWDQSGKEHRPVIGAVGEIRFDAARVRAIALRHEHMGEERRQRKVPVPTWNEAIAGYLRRPTLSQATVEDYKKRFKYMCQWPTDATKWAALDMHERLEDWSGRRIDEISGDELDTRYQMIARMSGKPTADGVARLLHAVLADQVNLKTIPTNPATVLRRYGVYMRSRKTPRVITRTQMQPVWTWLHTQAHAAVRDYIVFGLMTGLRESVLGSLSWDKIDVDRKLLKVPSDARGNKAKVEVWMPIPDYIMRHVVEPRRTAKRHPEWVIPSTKRANHPLRNINGSFRSLRDATGVEISDHDLRRTFASIAHAVTRDELMESRMLTHLQSTMTTRGSLNTGGYIVIDDDDMRKAFNRVANAVAWFGTHAATSPPPAQLPSDWDNLSLDDEEDRAITEDDAKTLERIHERQANDFLAGR